MKCPACDAMLVVLEHEMVEVDYCLRCRGVWLDAGELELLFGGAEACTAFLSGGHPAQTHEKSRNCPRCGRRMTKEATPGQEPICYDRCPRQHGLWLDPGERVGVLTRGKAFTQRPEVSQFLKELFPNDAATDPPREDG